jgi:hypothetical protein
LTLVQRILWHGLTGVPPDAITKALAQIAQEGASLIQQE